MVDCGNGRRTRRWLFRAALAAARGRLFLLAVTVAAGAGALGLAQIAGPSKPAVSAQPAWLTAELGERTSQSVETMRRAPVAGVAVAVDDRGYTVVRDRTRVAVSSIGFRGGRWSDHANGRSRETPFGLETITIRPTKTEQWLTVLKRQGRKTWRWRIETNRAPTVLGTGSIVFGRGDQEILPVKILDAHGTDVTPEGARWKLRHEGAAWTLALELDDADLPLPYFIDPASQYPTPLYQRTLNLSSSFPDSSSIVAGNGTSTNVATKIVAASSGTYQFFPEATNSTAATPSNAATDHKGWFTSGNATANTTFPAGDWSFNVTTRKTADNSGCAHVVVGMWRGNVNATTGAFVPAATVIDPLDAASEIGTSDSCAADANDVMDGADTFKVLSLTKSLPAFTLNNSTERYLLVRYYLKVYTAPTGGEVQMAEDSPLPPVAAGAASAFGQRILHPGGPMVDNVAPDETTGGVSLDTTPEPDKLWYKGDAAGSFKLRVDATDAAGITHVVFPTSFPTNWTAAGSTVDTPEGGSGTVYESTNTYSWTAGAASPGTKIIAVRDNTDSSSSPDGTTSSNNDFTTNHYLTIESDTTAPNGTASITANGSTLDSYNTSGTVSLAKVDFTDGQSGMSSNTITRAFSTLTGNTCPAPTGSTVVTIVGGNDSQTLAEGCYRYTLTGTDRVGNTATSQSAIVTVDTTGPSAPLTVAEVGADPDSHVSGTTLFYRPGGGRSGSFTVDADAADAESGIEKVNFPAVGSGVTRTAPADPGDDTLPNPYRGSYDWIATATASGAQTVTATNNAGGMATPTFTLTPDSSPPTSGAISVAGLTGSGGVYSNSTTLALTLPTPTDGTGSGVATTVLERRQGTLASAGTVDGSCDFTGSTFATRATNPGTALTDNTTSGIADGKCYEYRLVVTDNVGNSAVTTTFSMVKVDTTAPAVAVATVNEIDNPGNQHYNGIGTHFFRPAGSGSFTIAATSSDLQSGTNSVTFPNPNATGWSGGGGFLPAPSSGTTYTSDSYSWSAVAAAPGTLTISAINHAALPATAGITIAADSAAPTGGSISVPSFSKTLNGITITSVNFGDSDSGIASNVITRSGGLAPTSPGVCPGTGYTGATVVTSPDTVPTTGLCYVYTLTGTDNVGNTAAVSSSPILVDTTAPSVPVLTAADDGDTDSHVAGSIFLRTAADGTEAASNGGSFTVGAATSDGESGIEQVAFPSLGTNYSGGGDDTTFEYGTTYTWTTGVAAVPSTTVTATNKASLTSSTSFAVALDNDNPTGTTISCNGASCASTYASSVMVSLAGWTDGSGSGVYQVRYTTDGTTPSATAGTVYVEPFTVPTTQTVRFRAIDNVGNEEALGSQTITIDTVKPTLSAASTGGTATLTLTFSEALASTTTPGDRFVLSHATSASITGTGNVGISGSTVTVTLPSGPPAGQTGWKLTYTKPGGAGNLKDGVGNEVDAILSPGVDVTTGSDSVTPETTIGNGPSGSVSSTSAEFTFSSNEAGSTFQCKLDTGSFAPCESPKSYAGLAEGSHNFQVRAIDPALNEDPTPASRTWTIDTTAPTSSIGSSGPAEGSSTTSTGATFEFTASENSTFQCSLDGGTPSPCTSPKSYTDLGVGSHTFEVRATDAANNTGAPASRTWTIVSGTPGTDSAPKLASSSPADGVTVASISSITLTASEPVTWSSVTVTHQNGTVTPLAGSPSATSITRPFGPSSEGLHTVRATLNDGVNAAVTVTTHFTIWVGSPGQDAPPSEINAGGDEAASVTASNNVASVTVPAGATSDPIVLRIDPSPTTSAGAGFSIGTDTLEVTARRTADGASVTSFANPLDIHFPNAPSDAVPLRSQNGSAFQPIVLTFSHALPSGHQSAYFRDASGTIHIVTAHLTFFTLYRDIAPPTAPRSLVGVVAADGLTLRWEPASDNSTVINYVLLVDGVFAQLFGEETFEAKLGAFDAGDTRTFTIHARDAAGHYGPPTAGVRGVPNLVGLTLEQATAALQARGFTLGPVTGTTGNVVAQAPAAPGTATVASPVAVTVGTSSGQAKLVLKVASAKRISLASRKSIAVRVTVSARSRIAGNLVTSSGRVIQRYAARTVPSGASVLQFAIPRAKVTRPDRYRLQLRATASGQSVARTARVQIVPGVLKARFTPVRRPIGVAIVDGSIKGLDLGSSFRVNYVVPSLAFDVIGLHPAFIEAAVIDVTVVDRGLIRSLRQVFPELKILALAPTSAAAAQARADGASIALVKPVPASRVAALLRRTLGR